MRFLDRIPAQRSTLVLGAALVAVFALYILVRPESLPASRSYTSTVEQETEPRDEQARATPTPRAIVTRPPAPVATLPPTASPSPDVTATPTVDPTGTADPFGSASPSPTGTSAAATPPFARVPAQSGAPVAPAPAPAPSPTSTLLP